MRLYPYCLLQASELHCLPLLQETKKEIGACWRAKLREEVHTGIPGLRHLQMCASIPPLHRPANGAGSSRVAAELMQIHEYLCTFNISAHLCFFEDIGRCINAAGGRGNYERQASTGRGGACLCHSPALGAAEAQSLLHLQVGRSLTEQKALELETAEKPKTCLSAGTMAPAQKFQTPDNLKSSFLQSAVFFFEWYK